MSRDCFVGLPRMANHVGDDIIEVLADHGGKQFSDVSVPPTNQLTYFFSGEGHPFTKIVNDVLEESLIPFPFFQRKDLIG